MLLRNKELRIRDSKSFDAKVQPLPLIQSKWMIHYWNRWTSTNHLVTVYVGFVRPLLQYACPVWHSSLTCAQSAALERIQKRALRLIFPGTSYNTSLDLARIVDLETRRKTLCINFATKASRSEVGSDWFTENNPTRNLRKNKRYREPRCRTNRYQNSPIPFMTKLLNSNWTLYKF